MNPCVFGRERGSLRLVALVMVMCGAVTWLGCGGADGPTRYELSGSVTFDGNPVPAGQIVFEPDSASGNSGVQGYAEIRDGKYDTRDGKGVIGGPHQVRVTGFDRFSEDESDPAKPLFPEYVITEDLPKETTTKDFDVPANP